ncbi:hypothetical protein PCH_Pc22g02110 [Penicillium rubens Wisconsin 54-1255]|uniref:Uncharacterized protein n=1 Tax=Penicillium rubens (strain ATCC 28089 / DSM 1075 / NRRL 1951 / Wisconsin 54-1255) TaxID=500485 RepID=B6HP63_PENRW|nr:hypothetical protein PCH_Pc22g02110 [Penicillium rubens Wisconsin 54-1255]
MEDPPLIAVCSPSWSPSHLKGQIDNRFTDPVHRSERDLVPKAPVLSTKSPLCSQISARVLRTLHDPYKYSEEAVTCVSMVSLQELHVGRHETEDRLRPALTPVDSMAVDKSSHNCTSPCRTRPCAASWTHEAGTSSDMTLRGRNFTPIEIRDRLK